MKIAVYCGSRSGNEPMYENKARALGEFFGANGIDVVFGGGHVGLMGVVADATLASGGKVYGVIPQDLVNRELAHSGLTELYIAKDMHERKAKMAELADGFVALPGGIGTLEEILKPGPGASLASTVNPAPFITSVGFMIPYCRWSKPWWIPDLFGRNT